MHYIKLNKDTFISKIGIGSYRNFGEKLDPRESRKIILNFFDQGINFIDSSVNYADGDCEKIIGNTLKNNNLRKSFFIASKVFFSVNKKINDGLSRKNIKFSIDKIKQNYQTDYIDCVQCHRYDPNQNLHELVEIFESYINNGDIRYWGTTNWPYDKINKILKICKMKKKFIFNQMPINIFYKKNKKSLLLLKKKNFINIIYGVLAKGLLTNNFIMKKKTFKNNENINYNKKNIILIKKLFNICKKYDYSLEEFMYSLINSQKYVDVTLCGVGMYQHFKNLNFKKILNKKLFENNIYKIKKYEKIKDLL